MKTYKGYELIKEIAEGNIKDGTRFKDSSGNIYIKTKFSDYLEDEGGTPILDCFYSLDEFALTLFEQIKEDEINIQDIEELDIYEENVTKENIIDKINDIVIGLKYIDNKIKEK